MSTAYQGPQPDRDRDQKIRVSISAESLAALWLVGQRAHIPLTGPAVAGRILEEICRQGQVKPLFAAWRHRMKRQRREEEQEHRCPICGQLDNGKQRCAVGGCPIGGDQ